VVGCRPECTEPYQCLHYGESQFYNKHVDGFMAHTKEGKFRCRKGGNRLITVLLYLNDVETGGGTCFFHPAVVDSLDQPHVDAVMGRALFFYNTVPGKAHECDERTEHSGTVPAYFTL